MQRCVKCNLVDGGIKSGFLRGKQRYFCKICDLYFILDLKTVKPNKKNDQVTIVDLAKHLGKSVSTVSRALNEKSDISQQTRELVI